MEVKVGGRKKNWSQQEVDELQAAYLEFRETIDGKLTMQLTHLDKETAWVTIQTRVNSQSTEVRTIVEIKKKLSDLKSSIKKAERERRNGALKTGGGPPPQPPSNDMEKQMLEAIGDVAVGGFLGIDSFMDLSTLSPSIICPIARVGRSPIASTSVCKTEKEGSLYQRNVIEEDEKEIPTEFQAKLLEMGGKRLRIEEEKLAQLSSIAASLKDLSKLMKNK